MHVTVIKQEIVDKYPWAAVSLVKAFEKAKQVCYQRVVNPRIVPLAWFSHQWKEERKVLGPDPWAYGLGEANRKNLGTIMRYCHQQGLVDREMSDRRAVRRHRSRRRRRRRRPLLSRSGDGFRRHA